MIIVSIIDAIYWSKVHGCVKTSKTPGITAKTRLRLHPLRSDLNRNPRERKARLRASIFVRKYAYIPTVTWYPQAVKNAVQHAIHSSLNASYAIKEDVAIIKGLRITGRNLTTVDISKPNSLWRPYIMRKITGLDPFQTVKA